MRRALRWKTWGVIWGVVRRGVDSHHLESGDLGGVIYRADRLFHVIGFFAESANDEIIDVFRQEGDDQIETFNAGFIERIGFCRIAHLNVDSVLLRQKLGRFGILIDDDEAVFAA